MDKSFENKVQTYLHEYLKQYGWVDERMPECPDVEEKWQEIAQAYLPDGMREYNAYPIASLSWMMFLGMAMAYYWDTDWQKYRSFAQPYEHLRDKRGYDSMDEYILEELLKMDDTDCKNIKEAVITCATGTNNILRHEPIEPGTSDAFHAYVACLHQLYLMGMACELKRLGHKMTKL